MTDVKPATDEEIAFCVASDGRWTTFERMLAARIDADREEIAALRQAIGMLTTLHPTMVMDPLNPVGMALQVHAHVTQEIATLNAAWSRDMGINPPVTSAEARQIVATSNRERAREIAALKAEGERLTPVFLPCYACGSKGFSDIVHGAVVLCEICNGTGRAR